MAPQKEIITHLNKILKNELTSINQYFLHAKILKNMGLEKLAAKEHAESIDEMKHADKLIERILFLEGIPNLQDLGKLFIGETVPEMIKCDLRMEEAASEDLKKAIFYAEENRDFVTADLLHMILESEEEHMDWLKKQLNLIDKVGLENYLQSGI